MSYTQLYSIVNNIAKNLAWRGGRVIDLNSFIAFGKDVLDSPKMTEGVYNTLITLIGRTVFAIDIAEDVDTDDILVESFEYGSILQKLSFLMQNAQVSSEWDPEHPENPYQVEGKGGVIQKFFEQYIPAFSYVDVSYTEQLKEAFRGPESLVGFTDALYVRMTNAYRISKKGLNHAAIGGLAGYIYSDNTNDNYSRRVRSLLTEFNTLYRTEATALDGETALVTPEYLEYVRKQIELDKLNLNEYTGRYNDASVERRTTDAELKLRLSAILTTSYDRYYATTYNEEYVKLPKHKKCVNFGLAEQPQTIKVSLDGSNDITINNVLGIMFDKDAVVATMDKERFVNKYDEWNDRTVFKLTANRRYIVDPSENAILYLNA